MPKPKDPRCHTGGKQIGPTPSVPPARSQPDRPHRFRRSPRQQARRARQAFAPDGPGTRLMTELGEHAYISRLKVSDLDPSMNDHPSGRHDHATVAALSAAAARLFNGPFWLVLEAGHGDVYAPDGGCLHAHVVHHRNDGPLQLPRDTERCKWVYDAPGAWRYLHKSDPATLEALIDYTAACVLSPTGKPPRTRRMFRSSARSAWLESAELHERMSADPLPPVLPCGRCRSRCLCRSHCTTQYVSQHRTHPRGEQPAQRPTAPSQPVLPISEPSIPEHPRQRPSERVYTASQTPRPQPVGAPHGSPHRRLRKVTADAPPSRRQDELTAPPTPRRRLRLSDLFARPVADPRGHPRPPLHERLSVPERPQALQHHRGGITPGPAP
jgi:hypothetical protein